ncbi:MAG TPA: FHA domain-containing protein [Clostridia bacterium]|nr:FHA domain-containing protein [Clostridia bacterium]
MDRVFSILEKILYTEFIKNINLFTLVSSILKYVFVVIVLRFIYLIVRMIYLDISSSQPGKSTGTYLRLLNQRESLSFHVENQYFLGEENTIGRERTCQIPIDYIYLSKVHARIFKDGDDFFLEDLDSVNGTELNGQEIRGIVPLEDKDLINFVKLQFIFMKGEEDEY